MSSLRRRPRAGEGRDDVGGTDRVARGRTSEEAAERRGRLKRERISRMTPEERERMEAYLHAGTGGAEATQKRLRHLRFDDGRMDTSGMGAVARRTLERRRSRGRPDRALRARMEVMDTKRAEAAVAAADAELVLNTQESGLVEAEGDMERTYKLTQAELKRDHLDEQTAAQIFDLRLDDYAPYGMTYDRSGRYGLLRGSRGHVALMDCRTLSLRTEFHVNEIVRDATFLHNPTLMALAQKKNVFIYDDSGAEIHRLAEHTDVHRMEFLPYHWLLGESCRRRGRAPSMVLFLGPLFCAHCADPGADVVCACAVRRALVQAELLAFHTTLSLFLTLLLLLLSLSLSLSLPLNSHSWEGRLSEIPGHLHGLARVRSPDEAGPVLGHAAEHLQRHHPPGPHQWSRHALVPRQQRLSRQDALSPWLPPELPRRR